MATKKDKIKLRHKRVRAKISGTASRPRLSVYRSLKYIYAQLINDNKGETLVFVSNAKRKLSPFDVGQELAKKSLEKKIKNVVFDKGGFKYHGQIKKVAEGARKGGLKF